MSTDQSKATSPTPVPRRQMNVRLPEDLIEAIDVRRARKDLSRDRFVENALRYALAQHPEPPTRHR